MITNTNKSMMRVRRTVLVALLPMVGAIPFHSTQAAGLNTHLFKFSDTLETVAVEDALSKDSENQDYRLFFKAAYDYAQETLIGLDVTRTIQTFTVVDHIHTATLGVSYLFSPRILVGLDVPLHRVTLSSDYQSSDLTKWTLGDIQARVKFRFTPDDSLLSLAIMPYVAIPTGDEAYFISDDSYSYGGALLADLRVMSRLKLFGNAGYTHAKHAQFLNVDRSKRLELGGGLIVKILDWLDFTGESIAALTLPGLSRDQNPLEIRAGLRGTFGPVRAFAGGGLEGFRSARSNQVASYGGVKVPLLPISREVKAPEPQPTPTPVPEPTPTPEPKPVLDVKVLEEQLTVARDIKFDTAKATINSESFSKLDSACTQILKYIDQINQITIEGHTDSRGKADYNRDLSQSRANAVKAYLVGKGIPAEKLEAIGYGEDKLKVKEVDEATRAQNRRVEFRVNQVVQKTVKTMVKPVK